MTIPEKVEEKTTVNTTTNTTANKIELNELEKMLMEEIEKEAGQGSKMKGKWQGGSILASWLDLDEEEEGQEKKTLETELKTAFQTYFDNPE